MDWCKNEAVDRRGLDQVRPPACVSVRGFDSINQHVCQRVYTDLVNNVLKRGCVKESVHELKAQVYRQEGGNQSHQSC